MREVETDCYCGQKKVEFPKKKQGKPTINDKKHLVKSRFDQMFEKFSRARDETLRN
jgi:hypothetical protein